MGDKADRLTLAKRRQSHRVARLRIVDPDAREIRGCRRKQAHGKSKATTIAAKMGLLTGEAFDAYECEFCGDWHVGHSLRGE